MKPATLPPELEADIRLHFPPDQWDSARDMALKHMDPDRRKRLHVPLITMLGLTIEAHVASTRAAGDELSPADVTDILSTLLAAHVSGTANPRVGAGDIALEIGKTVSGRLMRMLNERRAQG